MTTARQALAESTHFRNEGLYWLKKAIEARRVGDTKGEIIAQWHLAKVTRQLRMARRWQAGPPSGLALRGLGVAE